MPFSTTDTGVYRQDVATKGNTMSVEERRELLERYMPDPSQMQEAKSQSAKNGRPRIAPRRRIRPFIKQQIHLLLYLTIQLVFGIYIRIRQIASALFQKFIAVRHYHHRTPAYICKDLKNLSRLPQHLSVIIKYDSSSDDGLETLLDEVAELSAWSVAAGIPVLSVYEKSGILKQYMPALQEIVQQKLVIYFGAGPATPSLRVFAPNHSSSSAHSSPRLQPVSKGTNGHVQANDQHIDILLLSESDGRATLVDLTRTLAEMAQAHKLRPKDITIELVDAEISATTSIPAILEHNSDQSRNTVKRAEKVGSAAEPDLLIVFAPHIKLDGYPPWQVRLTEIFCVGDSGGDVSGRSRTRVEYQGFLRALWNFAGAEFRFGA